jgi:hypothetical protein
LHFLGHVQVGRQFFISNFVAVFEQAAGEEWSGHLKLIVIVIFVFYNFLSLIKTQNSRVDRIPDKLTRILRKQGAGTPD